MTFFEEILVSSSHDVMMEGDTAEHASRLDTVPCDDIDEHRDPPALAPLSPCHSEYSSCSPCGGVHHAPSITGEFGDIKHKYHVDPRVLGTGHQGSVRQCIDRRTGRRHAVKSIYKCDKSVRPGGIASEIELLREMKHGNVVRLVDVFEDIENVHLVTDLCEGGELFDKIVERSSADNGVPCFAEKEAARLMHQILTAVSYIHEHNIVHRDIKPENILFETTKDNSPIKIIDFGLAKKHFGEFERPMSNIVGTPYYIAPEVLRKRYNKSCDLWSIGVIAYILLCGYPPFNGADNEDVYASVCSRSLRFPSSDWSCISGKAKDFVRRLLRKDPRKRMTVEQALNHSWIMKHDAKNLVKRASASDARRMCYVNDEEDAEADLSVEVVFNELSRNDSIICGKHGARMPVMPDL